MAVDYLTSLIETIERIVSNVKNSIVNTLNNTLSRVQDRITDAITNTQKTLLNAIASVENAIQAIPEAIGNLIDNLRDFVNNLTNTIISRISDTFEEIVKTIATIASRIIDKIGDFVDVVRDFTQDLVNSVVGKIGDIIDELTAGLRSLIGSIKDKIADLISFVTDVWSDIREKIVSAARRVWQSVESAATLIRDKLNELLHRLLTTIHDLVDRLRENVTRAIQTIVSWWQREIVPRWREIEPRLREFVDAIVHTVELILSGDIVGGLRYLDQFLDKFGIPSPLDLIRGVAMFWAWIHFQTELVFIPQRYLAERTAEINFALNPPPLGDVAAAVARGFAGEGQYHEALRLAGVRPGLASGIVKTYHAYPSPGAVQEAFLRGLISEEEHDRHLRNLGYTQEGIELLKSIYYALPTISDLVRMAVREVFTPEVVERFGQMEDLPPAFLEFAKKVGLSEEAARWYWAAHWDLPSPTQGFEMYQRGIINEDELKLLLRSLDIMPFWREKLIQLSYNPLTRVDVRRMYELGVLDEEGVYRAYLDLGYSPENARRLTEFTKRYSAPEDETELSETRHLARSLYSQAYRRRVISREEYEQFLRDLKYTDEDIELLIRLDDVHIAQTEHVFDVGEFKREVFDIAQRAYDRGLITERELRETLLDLDLSRAEQDLVISNLNYQRQLYIRNLVAQRIHDMYVDFIIDEDQVYRLFGMFNFSYDEQERLIQEWTIERGLRTRRPPVSELRRFLQAGLMSVEQFLDELRGLGYHEKYIEMYRRTLESA